MPKQTMPPIYFYIPRSSGWPDRLPETIAEYWPWISAQAELSAVGKFSWTLQTYLYLKADGFPCEIVREVPSVGIVMAHRDFLSEEILPGPGLMLVCLLADKKPTPFGGPHPYAQIHVVQNSNDEWLLTPCTLWPAHYMPQWPQAGLIARAATRGDRFENAAFFGTSLNLASELKSPLWNERLQHLGLTWRIVVRHRWHDYSDVDVVIAVRGFEDRDYHDKPPSKLHNCWLAGVPAILGRESAYLANRRSELDYIEARSADETLAALKRLRDDVDLRRAMAHNGMARAVEVQPPRVVEEWRDLIESELIPAYTQWTNASPWTRASFLQQRALARWSNGGHPLHDAARRLRIGLRTRLRNLMQRSKT